MLLSNPCLEFGTFMCYYLYVIQVSIYPAVKAPVEFAIQVSHQLEEAKHSLLVLKH